MASFHFFVEAETESAAIERARTHAREIVAEDAEFSDVHPLVRIPDGADEGEFLQQLAEKDAEERKEFREWRGTPMDKVDPDRLDRILSVGLGRRYYDLRGDGRTRVTSREGVAELRGIDDGDVYLVDVGVDWAYRPPEER